MPQPKLLPDHNTVLQTFNQVFSPGVNQEEMCNLCGGDIPAGSHISVYFSDENLADLPENMDEETIIATEYETPEGTTEHWYPHHAYCEECQQTAIVLPHEGTTEALYEIYTPVSNPLDEYGIAAYSLSPHGIDWNPEEILETVSGIPLEKFTERYTAGMSTVGHAEIVDFLRRNDIDIRKLIDKSGSVRVTSDAKEALRQKFNKEALRDKYQS